MTRLREALDRAAAREAGGRTAVPSPGQAGERRTSEDVPRTWRFEDAERPVETAVHENVRFADPPDIIAEPSDVTRESACEYPFDPEIGAKVVVGGSADSRLVEEFRKLGAVLHHAQRDRGIRSVMVASAAGAEGKTLIATNLALTLSHSFQRRVLLIDADLRRPDIHQVFKLPNFIGLGDGLRNPNSGRLPVRRVLPRLWVLTAGKPDPDPMSGLVSDTMKQLIAEAINQFDWVVLDTPPVALMPDANLLAAMTDAALIVVGANSTPYPLVKRAIDSIGAPKVLGVVLNKVKEGDFTKYAPSDHYYRYSWRYREQRPRPFRLFGGRAGRADDQW